MDTDQLHKLSSFDSPLALRFIGHVIAGAILSRILRIGFESLVFDDTLRVLSLEQQLLDLERQKREILSQLEKARQSSREEERFQLFRQEVLDIVSQFVYGVWKTERSRHFDLEHIFTGTGYSLKHSIKEVNENEIELSFPVFYDSRNPGRFKLQKIHFWMLPYFNQQIVSNLVEKERSKLASSMIGDMHRMASMTYVFLGLKGYAVGGKISDSEFVFVRGWKDPKFSLTRFFHVLKNQMLARLKTLFFKLHLTEKTDLRNPSNLWTGSTLTQTCEFNAGIILWGGPPLGLSREMETELLSLMRLACECERFEFHSEATGEMEGVKHSMFTMAEAYQTSNIVNTQNSFPRKSRAIYSNVDEDEDVRWKRDKDGIIVED